MANFTLRLVVAFLFLAGSAQAQNSQAFIESADTSVPGALHDYGIQHRIVVEDRERVRRHGHSVLSFARQTEASLAILAFLRLDYSHIW